MAIANASTAWPDGRLAYSDVPAQRPIAERIQATPDKRSGASDQSLRDRKHQARQADGDEQKAEPNGDRSQHALGHARKRRRGGERKRGKRKRDGHQEPNRFAGVGHAIEGFDQPFGQALRRGDRRRVDRDHRPPGNCNDHDDADAQAKRRTPQPDRSGSRLAPEERKIPGGVEPRPLQPRDHAVRRDLPQPAAGIHDAPAERYTAIVIGWPVLMLIASTRGPAV